MKTYNYNIKNDEYLGEGKDAANHPFHAFKIDDEIHIVYNMNESNQTVAVEKIETVRNNPSHYMWTPYIEYM